MTQGRELEKIEAFQNSARMQRGGAHLSGIDANNICARLPEEMFTSASELSLRYENQSSPRHSNLSSAKWNDSCYIYFD